MSVGFQLKEHTNGKIHKDFYTMCLAQSYKPISRGVLKEICKQKCALQRKTE